MSHLSSNASAGFCQSRFAQAYPHYYCQSAESFARQSEMKGYRVKCRDPRCSLPCRDNWARKLAACLDHRLKAVQDSAGIITVRGNLALPTDSTPDDHRRAKKVFLQRLNRFRARSGATIEIHATYHPTGPTAAHWDFVAYSSLSQTRLRAIISESWKAAGGRSQSVVPVSAAEIESATAYQAKVSTTVSDPIYLPLPKAECPLETTWHTAGFWGDLRKDGTWKAVAQNWLESSRAASEATVSNSRVEVLDSEFADDRGSSETSKPADERAFHASLPSEPSEKRRRRVELAAEHGLSLSRANELVDGAIRSQLAQRLPRNPSEAKAPSVIAKQFGIQETYLYRLLAVMPVLKTTDGHVYIEVSPPESFPLSPAVVPSGTGNGKRLGCGVSGANNNNMENQWII